MIQSETFDTEGGAFILAMDAWSFGAEWVKVERHNGKVTVSWKEKDK